MHTPDIVAWSLLLFEGLQREMHALPRLYPQYGISHLALPGGAVELGIVVQHEPSEARGGVGWGGAGAG